MEPNKYSTERAALQARFKRNRDHISGIDAVKDAGETYLKRDASIETTEQYEVMKSRAVYFPAAKHTHDAFCGLVFRKQPQAEWPKSFDTIASAITLDGESVDDLAEVAFSEALINFDGGMLADKEATPKGLTKAQAEALGHVSYAVHYRAEDILEISYGRVRGKRAIVLVKLADDDKTRRVLELVNGIYTVSIYKLVDGEWNLESRVEPMRRGKKIDFIPFVSMGGKSAPLDDVCALNQSHYIYSSDLAVALYWYRAPMVVLKGVDEDFEFQVGAGKALRLKNEDGNADAKYLAYNNELGPLERAIAEIKDHMSKVGARMLASEKASAESAETVARRQASEQSILAGLTRIVSRKIETVVRYVAWLEGVTENPNDEQITFALNTDFVPTPMTPQEMSALLALVQAGELSRESFFNALQAGEIVSEAVDFETERARIESAVIDKPVADDSE